MAVGKTHPFRQQMINMMYLVLTALLALNVSTEILNAFKTVNEGMVKSINMMDQDNTSTMSYISALMATTPAKIKPVMELANRNNGIADSFYMEIQRIIDLVIEESGGMVEKEGKMVMENMEDLEVAERLFVKEDSKYGTLLEKRINETRADFIKIANQIGGLYEDENASVTDFEPYITLAAESTKQKDWAYQNFHMVPSIAAVTVLTKIQQDIRNTQNNINKELEKAIGMEGRTVGGLTAMVKYNKSSLAVGDPVRAEVFLAAYDNSEEPEIYINGIKQEVIDGKAVFEKVTSTPGIYKVPGNIVYKRSRTAKIDTYNFEINYEVFKSPAVISPLAMNVIYAELENPIEVSVAGYKPEDVVPTISRGSLKRVGNSQYIATVPEFSGPNRQVTLNVSVKLPGGGLKSIDKKDFRVFSVPKPGVFFGTKSSGDRITRSEIPLVNSVNARLEKFPFAGIRYRVLRYRITYFPRGSDVYIRTVNGSSVSNEIKTRLGSARAGEMIVIDNIRARADHLGDIVLPPIVLTVQ